jgi:SAM-dependent methyltransferase
MAEDTRTLESIVDSLLAGRKGIKILDAGCGSMNFFPHNKDAYRVGIDVSQEQLDRNTTLNEKILGDLQEYAFPPSDFDMIICWHVLEHLPKPELALKNFAKAVNEGGIILLVCPNVLTVRGLLTKFTPHWVHVWYYRYVLRFKDAGLADNPPFKSYHRFAITPQALKKFARQNRLSIELFSYINWRHAEHEYALFRMIWNPINKLVNVLTFGKIGTDAEMGILCILRKQQGLGRMVL